MQESMIEAMKAVPFGLDFTTHIERVCDCQCEVCIDRGHHSVGNCEFSCSRMDDYNALQYRDDSEMYFECACDCSFCRSGTVVTRHSKLDCMMHCYKR
jgi:hypothetical protein